MSHLFEFNGAEGKGYSQPSPIMDVSKLKLPESMKRESLPRWPRVSSLKW